jgi:uncharacterized membrane protein
MNAVQARLLEPVIALHALAALIALVVGAIVLARRKGTASHRRFGRVWVIAMLATAVSSFAIEARILGLDTPIGRFGPIHLLSVVTIVTLGQAVVAIRRGQVRRHRIGMTANFVALVVAGAFTLLPGRTLGAWLGALLG